MAEEPRSNPFPGLRPFEPDEDHLFFGRERETDELLRRLRTNRFLAVVGTSGSGKSSLVRSGLIPSLLSGVMVSAGSGWRVCLLRPGEDPVGHLAAALDAPDVIGAQDEELSSTSRVLLDATLRRGTLGLVDAVRQARIPPDDNVLVVVDQFEELFRYRHTRQLARKSDDAVGFVKLLLEAGAQTVAPIYVVLTMRSDFLGDCMEYPGLPEAVNAGLYLVPRMSRDDLRSAITGPVAVASGAIAPRLVLRLLNEVGEDPDRLPVLQHALLRTWDHWQQHRRDDRPIDVEDFEAIGTLRRALSLHAEEAYREAGEAGGTVERMFKALTDTFTDPRGTRRPTSVAELAAVCETSEAEIVRIVEIFRRPGRSFLTPPADAPLTPASIVDLAHESLMRGWSRLIGWAAEERQSATAYARVAQAAAWWREGTAGLWRDPELELGLRWRRETRPTAAWARRYRGSFADAMEFLDRSEQEARRIEAEREAERVRKLRQAQWAAAVLGALLVLALLSTWVAWRESARAERNFALAREAVDETLSSTNVDPAQLGADVPELVAFRRDLLQKAGRFYAEFVGQAPGREALLVDVADAERRLGHIERLLGEPAAAERSYRQAIERFEQLIRDDPGDLAYRRALGDTYNWLGETLRPLTARAEDAARAYEAALRLQQSLVDDQPAQPEYQQELARTHYNRGILLWAETDDPSDATFNGAESSFRRAMELLEPLARNGSNRPAAQELARVLNNLGHLLSLDDGRLAEAHRFSLRAVMIHERLAASERGNREYALELALFENNLADLLLLQQQPARALERSDRALAVLQDLAQPAPSVALHQADSYTLRGRILEPREPAASLQAYRQAFSGFEALERREHVTHPPDFQLRFSELVGNVAGFLGDRPGIDEARDLLRQTLESYFQLVREIAQSGTASEARDAFAFLPTVWDALPASEQRTYASEYEALRTRLLQRVTAPQPTSFTPTSGRTP